MYSGRSGLPIQNLDNIGVPFEIKTSIIRMVQSSPFTGKEDANLHLQAFLQLCRTFDMQGMTLLEPERTIGELCTPDVWDLPIQNLDNIGVPFEIKTSII